MWPDAIARRGVRARRYLGGAQPQRQCLDGSATRNGAVEEAEDCFGSNNRFEHLPEALGECPSLEVVGFKATRIRRVDGHALPPRLRWLILTDNAIERLPDALGERPAMQKLMLAGNRLQALPEGLAQAQHLELLRLSANRLESLPHWLARLPRLAWLALAGNPLGWHTPAPAPLPQVAWSELRVSELLGEGACDSPRGTARRHPRGRSSASRGCDQRRPAGARNRRFVGRWCPPGAVHASG
ncbi:MAG: leucine-rich repeat domain-containing protein [Burkholderiaceae bacterium]